MHGKLRCRCCGGQAGQPIRVGRTSTSYGWLPLAFTCTSITLSDQYDIVCLHPLRPLPLGSLLCSHTRFGSPQLFLPYGVLNYNAMHSRGRHLLGVQYARIPASLCDADAMTVVRLSAREKILPTDARSRGYVRTPPAHQFILCYSRTTLNTSGQ